VPLDAADAEPRELHFIDLIVVIAHMFFLVGI